MDYTGGAEIRQGERVSSVNCSIIVQPATARQHGSWSGGFKYEDPKDAPDLAEALICLPDGREGRIIVNRLQTDQDAGSFVGTGPPPA